MSLGVRMCKYVCTETKPSGVRGVRFSLLLLSLAGVTAICDRLFIQAETSKLRWYVHSRLLGVFGLTANHVCHRALSLMVSQSAFFKNKILISWPGNISRKKADNI